MKDIFSNHRYSNWMFAGIFCLSIFLQCCFFHWLAFHSILISSLWLNPVAFIAFYLPKFTIALVITVFVFLFKQKLWAVIASILINIWIIAELIYFRANRIFLDAHSFTLISNMDGFWSSVPTYLYGIDSILIIPSVMVLFAYFLLRNNNKSTRHALVLFICTVCIHVLSCVLVKISLYPFEKIYFNPFSDKMIEDRFLTNHKYIQTTSVIHAFIYDMKKLIQMPFESKLYSMTEEDTVQMKPFVNPYAHEIEPKQNLILILVESLETWAIRPDITPNLCEFMDEHDIIFAENVVSQTKGGTSSDGQMIFNTGLLPIQNGAVCQRYPHNIFPSLSELYSNSALIQPGDLSVWNQKYMSDSYRIDTNYLSPQSLDHVTFTILDSIYQNHPYCMAITMASHSPFIQCSNMVYLDLREDMPQYMANYLKCLHYTDSCWGDFLCKIDTDSILKNYTICFMGDHIIFDSNMRNEFANYCTNNNLDYDVNNAHTAFIAYSPNIDYSLVISDTTYQMDAYPTILHLIGCEDYYWKGFGVNLLDPVARTNRPISEEDAYILSDKIIRADYFRNYINQQ